jgi:hypothetical protein
VYFSALKDSELREYGAPYYISKVIAALITLITVLAFFLASKFLNWIGIKLQLRSGKKNDFIGNSTLFLNDDFIENANSSITSQVKYSSVEKICFGYNCFFLYIGAIKAIIVPVSAFTDDSIKQKFLYLLKQKTGLDVLNSRKSKKHLL